MSKRVIYIVAGENLVKRERGPSGFDVASVLTSTGTLRRTSGGRVQAVKVGDLTHLDGYNVEHLASDLATVLTIEERRRLRDALVAELGYGLEESGRLHR